MPGPTRKLAAIMFTDIVGYSRIMSLDERKGLDLLNQHDSILQQAIEKNDGKILKKMGDAVFSEFNSSVSAVNCAIDIQTTLKNFNEGKPSEDKIIIRIGIHLGDVMVHGDDLFGEGINVAARLEPLAPPGGICLSQAVYQSVRSHTNVSAVHLGEVELKNIVEKYTVYSIPSFYAQDLDETSVVKQEKQQLDFRVKSINRLPPPSRSYKSMLGLSMLLMIASIFLGMIVGVTMFAPPDIAPWEIKDSAGLMTKLREARDPVSIYIRGQMQTEAQQLIDKYENTSSLSDSLVHVVRRDLNRLIRRNKLLFDEELLRTMDLPEDISTMILENPVDEKLSRLNRLLIGQAFPEEIIRKPEPGIFNLLQAVPILLDEKLRIVISFILFIILFILLISSLTAYYIAFTTFRVIFSHIRHVDNILEYFIEQMGFKQPIKDKGYLIFKPTFSKFIRDLLIGFPAKIRVRVDGNSVIVTSTIPVARRLEKQINSFSE